LVIQEEIAEKRCDEWFSQDRAVMPLKMTWRKNLIMMEKNKNADDTVAAQNFENNEMHLLIWMLIKRIIRHASRLQRHWFICNTVK
jgi:hypothetical protein